jgi:hypothetical protein
MGLVRDATGSFSLGLLAIAMGSVVGGLVVLLLGHDRRLEQAPVAPNRVKNNRVFCYGCWERTAPLGRATSIATPFGFGGSRPGRVGMPIALGYVVSASGSPYVPRQCLVTRATSQGSPG